MRRLPGHYRRRTWRTFRGGDEEAALRIVRDLGPPRYCKRCGCKLNSYNHADRCLPCQRYVIVNP
jgi:hypothetical protein